MATRLCRCVTEASTWTGSNRETGCSSINSLGLKAFVSIAGHRPICLSPAECKLLLPVPSRMDNGQR
jgi:hypothetical protein